MLAGLQVGQVTTHADARDLPGERVGEGRQHSQSAGEPSDPVLTIAVGQLHHGPRRRATDPGQVHGALHGDHPRPLRVGVGDAAGLLGEGAEVAPGIGAGIAHRIFVTAKDTS